MSFMSTKSRKELESGAEEIGRRYGTEEDRKFTENVAKLSYRKVESWLFHALILSDGEVTLGSLVDDGFPVSTIQHLQTAMPHDEENDSLAEYIHAVKDRGGSVKDMITARMRLNLFDLIESDGDQANIDMLELAVSIMDGNPYNAKKRHEEIKAYTV